MNLLDDRGEFAILLLMMSQADPDTDPTVDDVWSKIIPDLEQRAKNQKAA